MLGQNFLVDRNIVSRIIDLVAPEAGDHILEVGPGQGAMTREMVAAGATVVAVELDRRLAPLLAKGFASFDNFTVVEADILDAVAQDGDPFATPAATPATSKNGFGMAANTRMAQPPYFPIQGPIRSYKSVLSITACPLKPARYPESSPSAPPVPAASATAKG